MGALSCEIFNDFKLRNKLNEAANLKILKKGLYRGAKMWYNQQRGESKEVVWILEIEWHGQVAKCILMDEMKDTCTIIVDCKTQELLHVEKDFSASHIGHGKWFLIDAYNKGVQPTKGRRVWY